MGDFNHINSRKKRDLNELINSFYDYLGKHEEIYLSDFRKIEDPERRIGSPTDKHILKIISNIQERPYLYVKHKGRYTLLKLSTKARNPKVRYIQLNDQIKYITEKYEQIKSRVKTAKKEEFEVLLIRYEDFIENVIERLEKVRDREEVKDFTHKN